jgi:hypothetical protein
MSSDRKPRAARNVIGRDPVTGLLAVKRSLSFRLSLCEGLVDGLIAKEDTI